MQRNIIAIMRGLKSNEAVEIAKTILDSGITWLEVPLNSPNAFESIELIVKEFGSRMKIGAGTVLTTDDVLKLKDIGGEFIVSPNCNKEVIKQTKKSGLFSCPGVLTPTECFKALEVGADILKIFPANIIGIDGISALKAVLGDATMYIVGGVKPNNLDQWKNAGANGFGIGSSLYQSGKSTEDISLDAKAFVEAYDKILCNTPVKKE
ncbi:MAG: 2-dehydro-3-deoxy-6-phosphogalactonate aldolase [Ostreibacterium sp.]